MNRVMFKLIMTAALLALVDSLACKKEAGESCNCPPIIEHQTFEIVENASKGTVVGTIVTNEQVQSPQFTIIDGNTSDAFSIERTSGVISVNDSSCLDFETNPLFDLNVRLVYGNDLQNSDTVGILIRLVDVTPSMDGLVSSYNFNGDTKDLVGTNNGISYNVAYFGNYFRQTDKSLMFNGSDSYVNLQSEFDYEQMTISLWTNVKSLDNDFNLIYTSDNPGLNFGLFNIATRIDNGIDNLYFNISGQIVTVPIEKGTWYNVTAIKDRKSYKYYLNDNLVGSGNFSNYLTSDEGNSFAVLGGLRTLAGGFFDGFIDNLRIYNRVISRKEVHELYLE